MGTIRSFRVTYGVNPLYSKWMGNLWCEPFQIVKCRFGAPLRKKLDSMKDIHRALLYGFKRDYLVILEDPPP